MRPRSVFIITLLATILPLAACQTSPTKSEAERMDQIVRFFADGQQFMGAVLVARGDKVIFQKGYGFANLEWKIPNTTKTKFRLGSVTKQFTAASILLLEERGKLKTDDLIKVHM